MGAADLLRFGDVSDRSALGSYKDTIINYYELKPLTRGKTTFYLFLSRKFGNFEFERIFPGSEHIEHEQYCVDTDRKDRKNIQARWDLWK